MSPDAILNVTLNSPQTPSIDHDRLDHLKYSTMRSCKLRISCLGNCTVYFVLFYVDTDVSEEHAASTFTLKH